MARPKTKTTKPVEPTQAQRTTIINLKGSLEQGEWLESIHRKTHLAKTVIMRLALTEWAHKNGHAPFPVVDDDR